MRKHITAILAFIIGSHFTLSAKHTHHKSSHTVSTNSETKPKLPREVKDPRPELTMDELRSMNHSWGIDISHYQTNINWKAVAEVGPDFMFIKASEGKDIKDKKYANHYSEARKIGIPVGSYHFFSYKSPGREQARNFLSIAKHSDGDLLPVLDAEYTASIPSNPDKVTKELVNFVNTVYDQLGRYPIIYCNYRYAQTYLTESVLQKCKLWIVDYKTRPSGDWALWQTTNKFRVAGIKGHVDLNLLNKDTTVEDLLFYRKSKKG